MAVRERLKGGCLGFKGWRFDEPRVTKGKSELGDRAHGSRSSAVQFQASLAPAPDPGHWAAVAGIFRLRGASSQDVIEREEEEEWGVSVFVCFCFCIYRLTAHMASF